ncbi:Hypothetical predicted protein [Pelobates cultripes]|uniref:Uncharacterized protein n=1 Tax=Pelobates cultripes TaxID=61616 RepID=A0AAD1R458_PELCU|nr:Hypothetical predicted protein [Pelobates cultripes]
MAKRRKSPSRPQAKDTQHTDSTSPCNAGNNHRQRQPRDHLIWKDNQKKHSRLSLINGAEKDPLHDSSYKPPTHPAANGLEPSSRDGTSPPPLVLGLNPSTDIPSGIPQSGIVPCHTYRPSQNCGPNIENPGSRGPSHNTSSYTPAASHCGASAKQPIGTPTSRKGHLRYPK